MAHFPNTGVAWCAVLAVASIRSAQATAQTRLGAGYERGLPLGAAPIALAGADVRLAVLAELRVDHHLVATGIDVTVRDGIVELGGTVAVSLSRERAARVARVVRGVRAVVNRIRLVPMVRPDNLVATDARIALRNTVALSTMPIGVTVARGVVELTGFISTWEEQQLAERVVGTVPGARFCQNDLIWRSWIKRTPTLVAADVRSRLDWDPLVEHAPIRVSVHGGRVFLAGTAGSRVERRRAIELSWVKGVRAVDARELIVNAAHRPDANLRSSFPSDEEIATAIHDVVAYWPATGSPGWSSAVTGGVVTLRGNVAAPAEKAAVEAMVGSIVGVTEVRSELRGPWSSPPTRRASSSRARGR